MVARVTARRAAIGSAWTLLGIALFHIAQQIIAGLTAAHFGVTS